MAGAAEAAIMPPVNDETVRVELGSRKPYHEQLPRRPPQHRSRHVRNHIDTMRRMVLRGRKTKAQGMG